MLPYTKSYFIVHICFGYLVPFLVPPLPMLGIRKMPTCLPAVQAAWMAVLPLESVLLGLGGGEVLVQFKEVTPSTQGRKPLRSTH